MPDIPRFLFLTIGDVTWASSRYRSYWPAQHIPGARAMQISEGAEVPDDYDVYVWMKTGNLDIMRQASADHKVQFLEVCDPNWWWEPQLTRQMADEMTAFVAASSPAALDFREWYGGNKPIFVIPDRLELDHYQRRGPHIRIDPVRFVWFGLSINRITLFAALANLERLAANGVNLSLTICDNTPDQQWEITKAFPIYYIRWSLQAESQIIGAHDIALLPPYPGPWGRLKTNNKQLTAWACGLPVTTGEDYPEVYELATDANTRQEAAENGYLTLTQDYDVRLTARDWLEVVEKVENQNGQIDLAGLPDRV